jgi:nitrite reductase/ring-hydroxylating ferredoxin subunit
LAASNPAQPAPGLRLCAVAEIENPGAKGFRYREGDALFAGFLVRCGDAVVGYLDRCPHAGWPLASMDGRFLTRDGDRILCSGHGALFQMDDGLCIAGPCYNQRLWSWAVEVRDGEVFTV